MDSTGINYVKIPNNRFQNCPAIMADSRLFTDYRSSCYTNELLKRKNAIQENERYRQFLVNNALNIINENTKYNQFKSRCD